MYWVFKTWLGDPLERGPDPAKRSRYESAMSTGSGKRPLRHPIGQDPLVSERAVEDHVPGTRDPVARGRRRLLPQVADDVIVVEPRKQAVGARAPRDVHEVVGIVLAAGRKPDAGGGRQAQVAGAPVLVLGPELDVPETVVREVPDPLEAEPRDAWKPPPPDA